MSDLDIIITGHAHTGTPQALISNDTIIVSTNAYTSELGELQIFFDTEKKEIVSHKNKLIQVFDDEIKDDPSMLKEIIKWQNKVEVIASKSITQSTNKMERAYGSESNMGNMFADAMSSFDERIDFAMVNSGALRQDINAGTITKGDLISAFPFPNTLVMAITSVFGKGKADIKSPLVMVPALISCLKAPLLTIAKSILSSNDDIASANILPIFDSDPYALSILLVD